MTDTQNHLIAYQERESKRIQIFLYSLLFANCYALSQLYDRDLLHAKLCFMWGLLAALVAFYFWYRQDMTMTERFLLNKDEKSKDEKEKLGAPSDRERMMHLVTFIFVMLSVLLGIIGIAIVLKIHTDCCVILPTALAFFGIITFHIVCAPK